jgi:hypothetical protein
MDAGSMIGGFFGNVSGGFSNSIGEAVGIPSWAIPATFLVVGSGAVIILIYLLVKL